LTHINDDSREALLTFRRPHFKIGGLKPALSAKATEGTTMASFDIPLTVAFFLICTGILTWTALAIAGVWTVLGWLEALLDRIAPRKRAVRIYRHS
jgi:hypothetical protein